MRLFVSKWECSGCRACEQICPRKCIHMEYDTEGFMYPEIDEQSCVQCGLCQKICKDQGNAVSDALHLNYAAYNKNREIRSHSSSGGVFYELGREVIERGGVVLGAVFAKDFQVYHKSAGNLEELLPMMGSKYVQSDTRSTYSQVKENLSEGRQVLYSGTPCQIAGLKKYLQHDYSGLICASVICHGVPSPKIWRRYLAYYQGRMNGQKINKVEFRNKSEGWRHFHFIIHFANRSINLRHEEDLFFKGFLQDLYLRPSCYACQAKEGIDYADIILGDYWGIENVNPELDDGQGVSAVIVNTSKGQNLWESIEERFTAGLSDYESCGKYNTALLVSVEKNHQRASFYKELEETEDVADSISHHLKPEVTQRERMIYQYPVVMKYLKNKVKGWSICDFLKIYEYKRVVLYAITEILDLIMDDMVSSGLLLEGVFLCDTNVEKYEKGYANHPVISVKALLQKYQEGEVDCIIVCSLFHENEIIKALMKQGIAQEQVISIASIVFSVE